MKVELPFKDWNDIARLSSEDSYVVETEPIQIAQLTTERQKKSEYFRKAIRKSGAKKGAIPKISAIRG